ncbi:hypothetical protein [Mycoplasma sp. SG1]|uniref:amino acid kinase family protein n=1 Tax=Mycoplasma sp. SG1 TaxID=2810348 RepID=UPI00202479F9|nr:hypothetical protein [Mycoplasma sp. SG1]URM53232.1 hypothetical protein JRW51_02700 [Mycoplasma sp. SG1]
MKLNNFKRLVIKLSGESLKSKDNSSLFDFNLINNIVKDIKWLIKNNYKVAIIVGGGNIIRGREFLEKNNSNSISSVTADYMGMLATVLNAMVLKECLEKSNLTARIKTAFEIEHIGETHHPDSSLKEYNDANILIFACGIGSPFFSTDTVTALRALELKADLIIFAKHGISYAYDKDPNIFKDAKILEQITFEQTLKLNLQVVDASAIDLLKKSTITAVITNFNNLLEPLKKPSFFKGTILTNNI